MGALIKKLLQNRPMETIVNKAGLGDIPCSVTCSLDGWFHAHPHFALPAALIFFRSVKNDIGCP
jgi:hypothetical protein